MGGSLAVTNLVAALVNLSEPLANIDTNFSTITLYINNREVTFGLFANRPAPSTHGAAYFATDVGAAGTLYLDTGVAWVTIAAGVTVGTLANRPAFGSAGRLYFATDVGPTGTLYVDTGAAWALAITSVLDRVSADTSVSGSVAETTIYTKSIPANTLSTNVGLRLTIFGTLQGDGAVADTITLRFKYGATTLVTDAATFALSDGAAGLVANTPIKIVYELRGDNATNAQLASVWVQGSKIGAASATVQAWLLARGTAAIDSTAAQNLLVSVQHSGNSATNKFVMESAILEVL